MSINALYVAVLALLMALLPVDVKAQVEGAEGEGDPVVAIVNGAEIGRSEVAQAQRGLPQQYRSAPLETVFPQLLDHVINNKLIALEGRKANLQDDDEVKAQMALLEEQVVMRAYLKRHSEKVVTEEALRERYQQFIEENPPEEELLLRHILVETEAEARAVIEEIQGGAEFAEVAKAKSTGPSADAGGDIGYFGRDGVVPAFSEAAFSLQPGKFTQEPVKTRFGWHVIKVEDNRLLNPPGFEEKRAQLSNELFQEAIALLIAELREKATIERFNLDGSKPTE